MKKIICFLALFLPEMAWGAPPQPELVIRRANTTNNIMHLSGRLDTNYQWVVEFQADGPGSWQTIPLLQQPQDGVFFFQFEGRRKQEFFRLRSASDPVDAMLYGRSPNIRFVVPGGLETMGIFTLRSTAETASFSQLGFRLTQGNLGAIESVVVSHRNRSMNGQFSPDRNFVWHPAPPLVVQGVGGFEHVQVALKLRPLSAMPAFQGVQALALEMPAGLTIGEGTFSHVPVQVDDLTAAEGLLLVKTVPNFRLEPLPATGLGDGRLLRFSMVVKGEGELALSKMSFLIDQTRVGYSNVRLTVYGDTNYVVPHHEFVTVEGGVTGRENGGVVVEAETFNPHLEPTPLMVPVGESSRKYFELRGVPSIRGAVASTKTTMLTDGILRGGTLMSLLGNTTVRMVWSPEGSRAGSQGVWLNGYLQNVEMLSQERRE